MKILIFVILLIGSVISIHSQTLFPLNVGDKWRYWEYPTYFRIVENLEDTLLSNNKTYYHFSSGAYYRQEGDSVFIFDFSLNDEYLIFDFSAEVGDTITNIQYQYSDTLQVILLTNRILGNYLGIDNRVLDFFIDENILLMMKYAFSVADSLGIVEIWSIWVDEHISGAIINGVTYGNITNVDDEIQFPNNFFTRTKLPKSI